MEGDWGIGDFVGNPKGTYSEEYTTKETGEVTKKRFEGTFEGYDRLNGEWYLNDNLLYRGEYKNDEPYNGTYYDEDGNKTGKVVDGVKQSY